MLIFEKYVYIKRILQKNNMNNIIFKLGNFWSRDLYQTYNNDFGQ